MSSGIWVAASGAIGQLTALDTTANNLANASTPGFKAEQATFQEHLLRRVNAGSAVAHMHPGGIAEVGNNMTSGQLQITNRPLDVALRDDGFFPVRTAAGERYTRLGSLQLTESGMITLPDGSPLLNAEHRPILVSRDAKTISISNDGAITADGEASGNLAVVHFQNPRGLEREGNYMFRATARSGAAKMGPVNVESQALELSNISVVKGMTDIVSTTRTFEIVQKVIDSFSEIDRRAASDLIRVT